VEAAIIAAVIGLLGSVFVAVLTYRATKKREQEAEWRKERLVYYKAFVESLSGIVEGDSSADGHRLFAKATNNLLLFAPQSVVETLNAYRAEISASNQLRSQQKHDELLASLLLAIRVDIGIQPLDNSRTFRPLLWTSGTSSKF
jgi:hypothetical protein